MPRLSKGNNSDLVAGTLDMLVLSPLRHDRMHGYGIARFLRQISDDFLQVEEGSLYPALQRLDLNGLIEGKWSVTPTNRRARFYRPSALAEDDQGLLTKSDPPNWQRIGLPSLTDQRPD